jgi:hypothetical protein
MKYVGLINLATELQYVNITLNNLFRYKFKRLYVYCIKVVYWGRGAEDVYRTICQRVWKVSKFVLTFIAF